MFLTQRTTELMIESCFLHYMKCKAAPGFVLHIMSNTYTFIVNLVCKCMCKSCWGTVDSGNNRNFSIDRKLQNANTLNSYCWENASHQKAIWYNWNLNDYNLTHFSWHVTVFGQQKYNSFFTLSNSGSYTDQTSAGIFLQAENWRVKVSAFLSSTSLFLTFHFLHFICLPSRQWSIPIWESSHYPCSVPMHEKD